MTSFVPNATVGGTPIRRIVHIADGQRTREYVPAEEYDRALAEIKRLKEKCGETDNDA